MKREVQPLYIQATTEKVFRSEKRVRQIASTEGFLTNGGWGGGGVQTHFCVHLHDIPIPYNNIYIITIILLFAEIAEMIYSQPTK